MKFRQCASNFAPCLTWIKTSKDPSIMISVYYRVTFEFGIETVEGGSPALSKLKKGILIVQRLGANSK
jgi:hypothetical protein